MCMGVSERSSLLSIITLRLFQKNQQVTAAAQPGARDHLRLLSEPIE